MDKGKLFLVALACLTVAAAKPHNYNYEQSAPSLKWKVETMSAAEDRPETMSAAEDRPETMSAAEDRPETMSAAEDRPETMSAAEDRPETMSAAEDRPETMSAAEDRPEVHMDVTELITSKGYPCENHWVTTDDGYILNMQRIPHGRHSKTLKVSAVPRPAVLLQHGLLLTSTIFLLNSAQDSLGFLLADAGLDVWLANSRGNIYSTNHTMLDTQSNDFWDFSWDEMARYDLPAIIDFITKKTGQNQINYVGYSQGTTIGFAALSQSPQVAAKVKLFIALAPVGRVANITSVVRLLLPLTSKVKMIMKLFPHGNVNLDPDVSRNLAGYLCHERKDLLCERLFSLLVGSNPRSFDMSRLDVYMAHMPAGTSVRNLLHWAQAAMGGRFQHFDWGSPHANLEKYGQPNPPQYDLSRLKTPVAIFRGGQDALADTEDVRWLLPQLNVIQDVAVDYYNHMDFVAAPDAPQKIYWQLAAMLLT